MCCLRHHTITADATADRGDDSLRNGEAYTGAGIGHTNAQHTVVLWDRVDCDGAALVVVFDGVIQEIDQYLRDTRRVGPKWGGRLEFAARLTI